MSWPNVGNDGWLSLIYIVDKFGGTNYFIIVSRYLRRAQDRPRPAFGISQSTLPNEFIRFID